MSQGLLNRGLLLKALRETYLTTTMFAAGLLGIHVILASVLPTFFEDMAGTVLANPFFQRILRGIIGIAADDIGPGALFSLAWVHPVVLALLWAHEIMFCTRVPAGEVDRGTIDVLLALPVSRWQLYRTESAVWLASGMLLLVMSVLGHGIGNAMTESPHAPPIGRVLITVLNQLCLYIAVGGLACLVSACSQRKGRAVGLVFAVVVASFFFHVLGQFWEPAETFSFLGIMNYYQPHRILQSGAVPVVDMLVLAGTGTLLWIWGGRIFAHRDICTV